MNGFEYVRAVDLSAACSAAAGGVRPLGGGTSLVDLMRLRVETPFRLVDMSDIDLYNYEMAGADGLMLGAGYRMATVANDPLLRASYPALWKSLIKAASPQIRNVATLAGNLLQRARCSHF